MKMLKNLLPFVLICAMASELHADQVHVAVAANFSVPVKEIAAAFEEKSGHKVLLSTGSSGKFFAQIQNGAPFQVFLSADEEKPQALEESGFTVPESRFTYAIGTLVLWSSRAGFVDEDYSRLKNGNFNKLALANPKLAPYGEAAVEVLENLNLREATEAKWVRGESISQTYQFVVSGNADLGFVALSQVMEEGRIKGGSSWIIPAELYSPIRQDAVLLKRGEDNVAAKAFLDYLKSDEALAIIQSYGYKRVIDLARKNTVKGSRERG